MEKEKFLKLKVPVFFNKRTGQASIVLPKKKLGLIPPEVEIKIKKIKKDLNIFDDFYY